VWWLQWLSKLGSSRWVKARVEGGGNGQGVKEEGGLAPGGMKVEVRRRETRTAVLVWLEEEEAWGGPRGPKSQTGRLTSWAKTEENIF
jgi:hypothetical protein